MIGTPLRYHRPDSPDEAAELLRLHDGDARVLGGGTWLLPLMGRGEVAVSHVVDLRGLGLGAIAHREDRVEIGALATYEDVLADPDLGAAVPLLVQMAAGVTGGRALRSIATLVGSACYANPASEVPAVLVALGAVLHVHGPEGGRDLAASELYLGAFRTALAPGEFVRSFSVASAGARSGYVKVKLSAASTPIATAAAVVDATTGAASVTLGAVEAIPRRVDLSALTADGGLEPAAVEPLVAAAVADPWADVLADADYRRAIAPAVARRAVQRLRGEPVA